MPLTAATSTAGAHPPSCFPAAPRPGQQKTMGVGSSLVGHSLRKGLSEATQHHGKILCSCIAMWGLEAKSKGLTQTRTHSQNPRKASKRKEGGLLIFALGNDRFTEI